MAWLAGALVLGTPALAAAYSGGVTQPGCDGCHGSGDYELSLEANPASFPPGATVTMTLTVSGQGSNLGLYLEADTGQASPVGGQGLAPAGMGLTHVSPRNVSGGSASVSFSYQAPSSPGAVRFDVSTVLGNGNDGSGGDEADHGAFDFVFGCPPQTFYRDRDRDGYGTDETRVHCTGTPPTGYATESGDCQDSDERIHPGATEVCNQRDDDCNGEVDDDAIPVELYPDADGDGYFGWEERADAEPVLGCVPTEGLAAYGGDCAPDNPDVNPGVEEVCNLVDDDCDNRVDDDVRPRCGVGWCVREASTCEASSCTPGQPREETCNYFDDDCDGEVDEDVTCEGGLTCVAGECIDVPAGAEAPDAEGGGCSVDGEPEGGEAWLFGLVWLLLLRPRRRLAR